MIINIAHLYGNLLNTYGDLGNIMALRYELRKMGHDARVDIISLGDEFHPDKYDFVFLGGGQDYEQRIVQKDLLNKKDQLKQYIDNDGVMLSICGGYQLLGKYYYDANNNKIEGIELFDHYTVNQDNNQRFTGNIKVKSSIIDDQIYTGFENHGGVTYLGEGEEPFAYVLEGNGNNGEDKSEGFRYKNTIGTYLHGPLLAKNENLAKELAKKIIWRKENEGK